MLQKLNERIQGVVAWVVVILIAVTFTLFGVDYYMQSRQGNDVEVDVNGQPISKQALEVNYRRFRQQREPSQLTAASDSAMRKKVLSDLITNEVSLQAARKAGFAISPEQVDAAILGIPQFQQDGHFSPDRFQQALSSAMFTPESFRQEVHQGMLLNQQRFAFMGSAFALPGEVQRFVKLYMQTRDYDYLEIPASLFLPVNPIPDAEIAEYYKSNQNEFLTPEKVSIDYVRLSTSQIKEKITINPEDVKQYYEENKNSFLTPARWQVAHILFAIPEDASDAATAQVKQQAQETYQQLQKNPALFGELVKTKSADKLSIASEGVLPWLVAGRSNFDKELANLTQPGQISSPIKANHGYEIFKLIAYKPASLKSFDEVEGIIKEQLLSELAQTEFNRKLEKLSDLSYQSPDSLEPVANALKLTVEHTEPFSRQGGDADLTKNKQIVNAAFSHDVLQLGNNSDPIQLNNDSVVVLRVNKHLAAAKKSLTEVKDYIAKKLALQQAEKEAKQFGTEFLTWKEGNQQEKWLQAKQLTWNKVENATREAEKVNPIINELAFNLPRADTQVGHSLSNGNYIIVRLKKINNGHLESLDKEQQASVAQQIESNHGVMDYDLYINQLVATAKIEKPNPG